MRGGESCLLGLGDGDSESLPALLLGAGVLLLLGDLLIDLARFLGGLEESLARLLGGETDLDGDLL